MLLAFLKLFLMTPVLNNPCLSDKGTTVVRRDVRCITQVYPGKPQGLICNPVSALFKPSSTDTDGCVSWSGFSLGQSKYAKQRSLSAQCCLQLPTAFLNTQFFLNILHSEYLSPDTNQISFKT